EGHRGPAAEAKIDALGGERLLHLGVAGQGADIHVDTVLGEDALCLSMSSTTKVQATSADFATLTLSAARALPSPYAVTSAAAKPSRDTTLPNRFIAFTPEIGAGIRLVLGAR